MVDKSRSRVEALFRYPVKGLSAQPLECVDLVKGQPVPFDRAWAIQDERGRFDPSAPKYLPKVNFLMLMRDAALATLETRFDEEETELAISLAGREVARGNLMSDLGRREIERFLAGHMALSTRGAPRVVCAPGHSFSDVSAKCLHIVNRASVAELSLAMGRDISALRFRPNVIVDGWPAWFENSLVGKQITIGGVRLKVFKLTVRCAATNVDPQSGARDMAIPDWIFANQGHQNFGVYAKVLVGGQVSRGDALSVPGD